MSGTKINAVLILEVLGRPKEHLVETLKKLIEEMKAEKGVSLEQEKIHDPVEAKDKKGLFTSFAEIEVEVETPLHLALLAFKYMPSNVEVISPERLEVTNHQLGEMLSGIIGRLHRYDELARIMQVEKKMLENKLKELEKK